MGVRSNWQDRTAMTRPERLALWIAVLLLCIGIALAVSVVWATAAA